MHYNLHCQLLRLCSQAEAPGKQAGDLGSQSGVQQGVQYVLKVLELEQNNKNNNKKDSQLHREKESSVHIDLSCDLSTHKVWSMVSIQYLWLIPTSNYKYEE